MIRPPITSWEDLIFQELTRQYLKEWGANWQKDAPQDFVYLDKFQSELFPPGKERVVILSQVLPANSTIGYDDCQLSGGEEGQRETGQLVARPGRSGENAGQRLSRYRNGGRPETTRSRRSASDGGSGGLQKNYGLPALQRL